MPNLLFVTWNGGGNQPPERHVAVELQERGHNVRWLTLPAHPPDLSALPREQRTPAVIAQVMTNPDNVDEIRAELSHGRIDAMVVDCLLFGALAAARLLQIPSACFIHTVPGGLGGPTSGFPSAALLSASIATMLEGLGLPVEDDPWALWADANPIVASFRELDLPISANVPEFDWIGPLVPRPSTACVTAGASIVVSLSTYPGFRELEQPKAQRILDGLAGLDRPVHLTAPNLTIEDLRLPDNVVVHGYVPHEHLLEDAALLITHGGHGSICAALAYGVPLLVVPNPAADQPYLAERIQDLGAGRALPYDAAPDQVNAAVSVILRDTSYAQAARRLQTTILGTPGAARAADRIEALTQAMHPS